MSLNLYASEDVGCNVLAIAVAIVSTSIAHGGQNVEYTRGALYALHSVAIAHGCDWTSIAGDVRQALGTRWHQVDSEAVALLQAF